LDNKLPPEALNIFLFSSQPCENLFHCARATTGPLSSINNFTVQEFLSKSRKITILNEIKTLEAANIDSNAIKFPVHHKQKQNDPSRIPLPNLVDTTIDKIEENIYEAYEYAKNFVEKLKMDTILKENNVFELNDLCSNMHEDLTNIVYITDDSMIDSNDSLHENSNLLDEETTNYSLSLSNLNIESDDEYSSNSENECITTARDQFEGMRIYSNICDKDKEKFFKITINGVNKFIHKQTAVWYFTKKNNQLSADRLVRVQKMNKQK
jgi:hypothetical protein